MHEEISIKVCFSFAKPLNPRSRDSLKLQWNRHLTNSGPCKPAMPLLASGSMRSDSDVALREGCREFDSPELLRLCSLN